MTEPVKGALELADGTTLEGLSFGADKNVAGEAVFQTGMAGYGEGITDPSYEGQILILTYPLIGNYGVPSHDEKDYNGLQRHFESNRIHVKALVVGDYSEVFSNWEAVESLSSWLKREGIPAIYGVDTRYLTQKLRVSGSMLSRLTFGSSKPLPWMDPNTNNLVSVVSRKQKSQFMPDPAVKPLGVHILCVDVGMKANQIRCFTDRGAKVTVVPYDYNFTNQDEYDGLFISNGPGDPTTVTHTVDNLKTVLADLKKPVFGICLGHQLLSLAVGAKTAKLPYGNRGHNIPCIDQRSGRCFITTQNHGFAVDASTLPAEWEELFVNGNDGTNEGIIHKTKPIFSVQFHPESTPGPRDTEYLFDYFLDNVQLSKTSGTLSAYPVPAPVDKNTRIKIRKVVLLGSGGLSIGQAGEFDYSGSQCIKALKEENIQVVLINSNIATVQTSKGMADKTYFLPVTPEYVMKVIRYEQPDGILLSFGGQTALNCGIAIKDQLEALGIKVLGTPIATIENTEDRELFARKVEEVGEHCALSATATTVEQALEVARTVTGYPVMCRAAFTLGGLGSGIADTEAELRDLVGTALTTSPQVLIEKSMKGWKEVEYEVVRDIHDNCITVCNMENFDPLGIHTGDSIVVAPSQTLSDVDYHRLRTAAIKVVRHLGVVGECNIQYAVNPDSDEYCIIEVNARLSRSSALASKATGYPLAFVAAKLALGIPLTEIKNSVTKVTSACFEPSLDYVVVKIPRWDLRKFRLVSTKISSSMKSVGEVMSIGRSFEEALQKAIRAIDDSLSGFQSQQHYGSKRCSSPEGRSQLDMELSEPTDTRLFSLAEAFENNYSVHRIWELTKIDKWFLSKCERIVEMRRTLQTTLTGVEIPYTVMKEAKQIGFSDKQIAVATEHTDLAIRAMRKKQGIIPVVKQIDTVAAEFPAQTNYLYMTYNGAHDDVDFTDQGVMVLGSGVYRIGSSVEFDWCAVRAIRTLREQNLKTVMINYNPETVSTDYDEADRLYFENITLERVMDIYEREVSSGVIVSMGGQVPNNIALKLHRAQVKILGTSPIDIDNAENRFKFSRLMDKVGLAQPAWKELTDLDLAEEFCERVGYPVLVRPSYVLSGAAMNVVYSAADLSSYLGEAVAVSREFPVVISKFIEEAKEIEVDAVAKGGVLVRHVVSEHIENAGVHSGDATIVQPPQDLDAETLLKVEEATRKIGNVLNVTGPYNIQFIAKDNEIKVIECNLRSSRSFPFVSKTLDIDLVEEATKLMMGIPFEVKDVGEITRVGCKVPQFSFGRLRGADPILGVEMASTGEVACFGSTVYEAYLKGLLATGFRFPQHKKALVSIGSYKEKHEFLPSMEKLRDMGFELYATPGTADFYAEHGVQTHTVDYLPDVEDDTTGNMQDSYSMQKFLEQAEVGLYVCLPSRNRFRRPASMMSRGYLTRRMAIDLGVPLITNVKIAKLFTECMRLFADPNDLALQKHDFHTSNQTFQLPGLFEIATHCRATSDFHELSRSAVRGGFTTLCVRTTMASTGMDTKESLVDLQHSLEAESHCDFVCLLHSDAAAANVSALTDDEVFGVELSLADGGDLRVWSQYFKEAPRNRLISIEATGMSLGAALLLASVHKRGVHITQVSLGTDLELIKESKAQGVEVTCDANPLLLAMSSDEELRDSVFDSKGATMEDVNTLWSNMELIDCFSTGKYATEWLDKAVGLMVTAMHAGRLSMDDLVSRFHTNPARILGIRDIPDDTYVELDIDVSCNLDKSPMFPHGRECKGRICRAVIRKKVVFVDGVMALGAVSGSILRSVSDLTQVGTDTPMSPRRRESRVVATKAERRRNVVVVDPAAPASAERQQRHRMSSRSSDLGRDERVFGGERPARPRSTSSGYGGDIGRTVVPKRCEHLLEVKHLTKQDLRELFLLASELRGMTERISSVKILEGKILVNAFYEASTRTSCSFEAAMKRLGGEVINVNVLTSSVSKGETLADTIRTLQCYSDAIVLRHPGKGSVHDAADVAEVPIINAGDGTGEHPTQALLDVYTIREELGTVNGLNITLVGDLKHGRTCHSLARLLKLYEVNINYVSLPSLRMPQEIKDELRKAGKRQEEFEDLDDVIANTDVLYVTRVQEERFENKADFEEASGRYVVTPATLKRAKSNMIIMHPLPRIDEISTEVDYDQRAAYFRQMKYGLYVRMALLAKLLDGAK